MRRNFSKQILFYGLIPALIAVVFFGLNFFSSVFSNHNSGMKSLKKDDKETSVELIRSKEKKFFVSMIPHHEEAVETSQFVLAQTKDSELRNFLIKVISTQTAEIEQMKALYTSLFEEEYKPDGTYSPMMKDLQSLSGDKLEKTYVQGMILHHQGALDMAKPVVELGESSILSPFARKIIDTQTAEVLLMQGWLETKYGQVQIDKMQQHMMH